MITRQGTWGEVRKHSYVQGPNGIFEVVDWTLDQQQGHVLFYLRNPTTPLFFMPIGNPNEPVTIVEPDHDEALAMLTQQLGAGVVAEIDHQRRTIACPPFLAGPGGRGKGDIGDRAHLRLVHGIWTEEKGMKTAADLHAAHEASHADPDDHFVRAHTHKQS